MGESEDPGQDRRRRFFVRVARHALKRFYGADGDESASSASAEFQRELLGLAVLRHPHVVQLLGACRMPPNLCLVLEYMPYSLHELLHEKPDVDFDLKRQVSVAWTWSLSRVT